MGLAVTPLPKVYFFCIKGEGEMFPFSFVSFSPFKVVTIYTLLLYPS
ncbi:hypothetical protein OMAG_000630 [Candidatus Omnitrophus magneticus]|uniref:Uncharacterized protein n=1 Tax=Candidatus Omnitrophus magneticus TaxID=1609969 RepID=A0A0F0CVM8_9BACT|nr:hypothetical protein OMAG_000635 [Candidatus Omnitrophus magneticus]KJJ85500.1 hypothetical protein OMAG_000630 [Candidatus Omnitrophus magneticus]